MIASAALPAPSAAMPQVVEGPSSAETPAPTSTSGAAAFLALLGAANAAGKKSNLPKPSPIAAHSGKPATAVSGETKGEGAAALSVGAGAEPAKAAIAAKTALKTAGDAKAEGDAAKAQAQGALPAAILEALASGLRGKEIAAIATASNPEAATDEPGKIKTKAMRAPARREGEHGAKPDGNLRAPEAAADAARTTKAEGQPNPAPTAHKPAETAPVPIEVTAQLPGEPQSQALHSEPQVTETRIPLAAREAAQAGFAAPVLAMRVNTKDGVTKSIEIRLDPAELGQVDVKLETGHDGKLKAVLSADNADAFELLKKDSGALEAALREAGIDLEEGAITFALNDSGGEHAHEREAAYGGAEARRNVNAGELAAAAAIQTSSWRAGAIDISV